MTESIETDICSTFENQSLYITTITKLLSESPVLQVGIPTF